MTSSDTLAGERLVAGRYRLRHALGRGGMGVVWAAEDELLQRPVAVKEIQFPPTVTDDERDVLHERTMREARASARLDHPCAVRVFDVCEDGGAPFIVMEQLVGRTLSDVIHEEGPLAPARVAGIGLCLLDALEAAHAAGIVHRDVKPGNVFVRDDGRVALMDFGIASTAGDPSITSTGLLLGSPAYIAPERARGGAPEPASDLFSLGATLYTAVEGRPPFDKPDAISTLTAVVSDEPQPCERAGDALCAALHRLLAKDPEARPTPAQLRTWLEGVSGDSEAVAPPDPVTVNDAEVSTGGHTVALDFEAVGGPAAGARVAALVALAAVVFLVTAGIGWALSSH